MYIDSHTHLYDEDLIADKDNIQRAIDTGVHKMYMPNCNSATIEPMLQIADNHPKSCFAMMGLHPCYVKADYKAELDIVKEWLGQRKFSAIGEIGLDYYWDLTFKNEQIEAFEIQIDLALQYNLPIVIHSRESTQDCIDIVRKKQNGNLNGIFHCFGGTLSEAQQICDLGFYLGIGGVVTFKNSTLPAVLKDVPMERIVLETDAPYLAPVPYRGKRNESSYIPIIAARIAEIKGIRMEAVASITTQNSEKVFGN